jgi:hypothetical protein
MEEFYAGEGNYSLVWRDSLTDGGISERVGAIEQLRIMPNKDVAIRKTM